MKLYKIAERPQLSFNNLRKIEKYIIEHTIDIEIIEQVEIHLKYSGYIEK